MSLSFTDICVVCPDEVSFEQKQLRGAWVGNMPRRFCSGKCYRIYQYHEGIKRGESREIFLQKELKSQFFIKQLEKENFEGIQGEVRRIANNFEKEHNLVAEITFGKKGDKNFVGEHYNSRGLCRKRVKTDNTFGIYILSDLSRGKIFRTLAHEFSHALTWGFSHLTLFWETFDKITLPFVIDNLNSSEDKDRLIALLKPSTNNEEEVQDCVYLEPRKGNLLLKESIDKQNVDQIWERIRNEVIKGDLGIKAKIKRSKKNPDKHWIYVYTENCQDKEDIEKIKQRLLELGFESKEF